MNTIYPIILSALAALCVTLEVVREGDSVSV